MCQQGLAPRPALRAGEVADLWVLWDDDFQLLADLEFTPQQEREFWLAWELPEMGLPWLMGLDRVEAIGWLLEHGIAPLQPFRIRLAPPTYTRDYFGEYDATPGALELVAIERWPSQCVVDAWHTWLLWPRYQSPSSLPSQYIIHPFL